MLFLYVHHHLLGDADDSFFKDKSVKATRAIFKEKEPDHVDYEFKVWKGDIPLCLRVHVSFGLECIGTAHGFALRPNLNVPVVESAYEGCLDQTVTWFKKTL